MKSNFSSCHNVLKITAAEASESGCMWERVKTARGMEKWINIKTIYIKLYKSKFDNTLKTPLCTYPIMMTNM